MLGSHKMTPGTKLKEAERAMIKMTMAAKIPIFLFMEIVIHSFLTEGSMITPLCCNTYDMIQGQKVINPMQACLQEDF